MNDGGGGPFGRHSHMVLLVQGNCYVRVTAMLTRLRLVAKSWRYVWPFAVSLVAWSFKTEATKTVFFYIFSLNPTIRFVFFYSFSLNPTIRFVFFYIFKLKTYAQIIEFYNFGAVLQHVFIKNIKNK